MNIVGIDIGKRECRSAVKGGNGHILNEFVFNNEKNGIDKLTKIGLGYGKYEAVAESSMWIRIHDVLEDNGIDTVLANPYKTRIIAEAKVRSDKLDARIVADLLRSGPVWYFNHMFHRGNLGKKKFYQSLNLVYSVHIRAGVDLRQAFLIQL